MSLLGGRSARSLSGWSSKYFTEWRQSLSLKLPRIIVFKLQFSNSKSLSCERKRTETAVNTSQSKVIWIFFVDGLRRGEKKLIETLSRGIRKLKKQKWEKCAHASNGEPGLYIPTYLFRLSFSLSLSLPFFRSVPLSLSAV